MRRSLFALIAATAVATSPLAAEDDAAVIERLTGGTAIPAGSHSLVVPNHPKQSLSFRSDAEEVIVGTVEFGGETPTGMLTLDGDAGTGTASFTISVAAMKTGNATRDEHMLSPEWLNAAANPTITFSDVSLTRIAPTVWRGTGTWTLNGVSNELTVYANVRFIPSFPRFGENVVRVDTSFALDLPSYGVNHPAVGSPAVAQEWTVNATFLSRPE